MTPKDYIIKYLPAAMASKNATGIHEDFTLAQTAWESGWGEHAPGFNFGGIKDTDGINGNEQLLTTTEYMKSDKAKFPVIVSKAFDPVKKLWKYIVKDYFRKYKTADEFFIDHCNFFIKNSRYKNALVFKDNPYMFAEAIAKAGYATDPSYAKKLKDMIDTIRATRAKNNL